MLTKRTDATSHIYRVPTSDSTIAERVATISTGTTDGLPTATTAADLWPNGRQLLVRGYLYSFELSLEQGGLAEAASATHTAVTTGVELQGEAIAYDAVGRAIWHIGEGVNPPIWRSAQTELSGRRIRLVALTGRTHRCFCCAHMPSV